MLTESIAPDGVEALREISDVVIAPDCTDGVVGALIADADGLIVRSTSVTEGLLGQGPRLKVVGRHGVGLDNIDVDSASRIGICVVHTPEANCNAVAEHTMWAIMQCARNYNAAEKALRAGEFDRVGSLPGLVVNLGFTTKELSGKVLGLIGLGRIARRVAVIARTFDMKVRAFDPIVDNGVFAECGVTKVASMMAVFERADFVSIHVPYSKETRHLIGENELRLLGPEGYIVNTSRGGIIDEAALYEMLRDGSIAGAALDVFEEEPPRRSLPLFEFDNVMLTPHIAAMTDSALARMSVDVCSGVIDVLTGRRPKYLANPIVWNG